MNTPDGRTGESPMTEKRYTQAEMDAEVGEQLGTFRREYAALKANAEKADAAEAEDRRKAEAEAERAALVASVARRHRVPAEALRGGDRDELEAHARALAAMLPAHLRGAVPGQEKRPPEPGRSPVRQFASAVFGGD